jgi:cellulose synthase/poly-beta-1,6-N-acetylglucosamine synthase-like glycosyltransferase
LPPALWGSRAYLDRHAVVRFALSANVSCLSGRAGSRSGLAKPSVLLLVYNEAATLAEAVKSVLAVDYPYDTELVIVSVGSADQTPEIRLAP